MSFNRFHRALLLSTLLAAVGCDAFLPDKPTGTFYDCPHDIPAAANIYACITDKQLDRYPGMQVAACEVCLDDPNEHGCYQSYDGHDDTCDDIPDWEEVVDENDLATFGWRMVSKGVFRDYNGNDYSQGPFPLNVTWEACAYAKFGALNQGREACVETVGEWQANVDGVEFWVNNAPFVPFVPSEYCEEIVYNAVVHEDVACPDSLVLDPSASGLTWADGTSGAVDCDLNQTCCDELGVCSALHSGESLSQAREQVDVAGDVHISHMFGKTSASIEGSLAFTASDCVSETGNCPLYVESIELTLGSLSTGDRTELVQLDHVTLTLDAPTMGVWRPDTGEIYVPAEALLFQADARDAVSTTLGSLGAVTESQRATTALTGTWDGTNLTLQSGRSTMDYTVEVDVASVVGKTTGR